MEPRKVKADFESHSACKHPCPTNEEIRRPASQKAGGPLDSKPPPNTHDKKRHNCESNHGNAASDGQRRCRTIPAPWKQGFQNPENSGTENGANCDSQRKGGSVESTLGLDSRCACRHVTSTIRSRNYASVFLAWRTSVSSRSARARTLSRIWNAIADNTIVIETLKIWRSEPPAASDQTRPMPPTTDKVRPRCEIVRVEVIHLENRRERPNNVPASPLSDRADPSEGVITISISPWSVTIR